MAKKNPYEQVARAHGYVKLRTRKHQRWEHPVTGHRLTTPISASDRRGIRNLISTLKRNPQWHSLPTVSAS